MKITTQPKSAFFISLIVYLFFSFGLGQNSTEVWMIPIDTEITTATAQYVKARVQRANAEQPLALVIYLDTPGGQIIAAERIVNSILQDARVPTIAVVSNAISAGAIIAMSAEQVAMLPGSSIGAATAINAFSGENAGEKINSVWRSQFRSVAEARGRNPDVAAGMVSKRIEIPGLSTTNELITLTASQAIKYNIADIEANNINDALEQLGYGGVELVTLGPNLAERFGGFLANPLIAALLLAVGIGGILIELFAPGFGLPGIIGTLALVALAAGAYFATPATTLDVMLILIGGILLVLELLVIPGFGIAGILGLAAIAVAVIKIFPDGYQWVYVLGYTTIFGAILTIILFWLLPNSRFMKLFALNTDLGNKDNLNYKKTLNFDQLLGKEGLATSDLRPAGLATIDNHRVDVVTEGDYISNGSKIKVIDVSGTRIVVKKV
ncbi:MAG TPA: nodulation protein NfeD [Trueperaceae bacterium]|nr:nodulation protein NfeD [Trueperaceae bacterium]